MSNDSRNFRDLPARLTRKSWLLLMYALAASAAVYLLGYLDQPAVFFLMFELPLIVITSYVISPSDHLQERLPVLWFITLVFLVGWNTQLGGSWLVVSACWAMVLVWLVFALREAGRLLKELRFGLFVSVIGSWMLAISLLLTWIGTSVRSLFLGNPAGTLLVAVADGWLATAPARIAFAMLVFVGLAINAAVLMADDPYSAPALESVPSPDVPWFIEWLVQSIRYPVWIAVVIVGFARKLLEKLVAAGVLFLFDWFTQVYFAVVGLILGPLVLGFAHVIIWEVAELAMAPPGGDAQGFVEPAWRLIKLHGLGLTALALYSVSPAFIGLRRRKDQTVIDLWQQTKKSFSDVGKPAAISVGRSFSVIGLIVVAVPFAASIPGGPGFGPTAKVYTFLLILGVVWYGVQRINS